jgi:CelD/BcsL family acetyltransferase involved in cellulose biosynthesis
LALSTVVIDDEAGLEGIRDDWDALAVRSGAPFAAPGWMLAWWRNARPERAAMRVVAVFDGARLVGLAPLFAMRPRGFRSTYEVMSAPLSPPAGPLAEPGCRGEVLAEVMNALAKARPKPRSLRLWDRVAGAGLAGSSTLRSGGGAWIHTKSPTPLPTISLEGRDYEEWFATISSKLRQESRRKRRRVEDAGGSFHLVGPGDLDRALDAFVQLHGARWSERGGSNALVPGLGEMLKEAAAEMVPDGRMRIFTIEVEERPIAVNILVAAGGEVAGWSSGFDEQWSRFSPSILLTLHAIADAAERGEHRINMGPGLMSYKLRLADGEEEVALTTVVPRDSAYPLSRILFVPQQLRGAAGQRLSDDAKRRLRRLTRR